MKVKKSAILYVVIALAVSTLACALPSVAPQTPPTDQAKLEYVRLIWVGIPSDDDTSATYHMFAEKTTTTEPRMGALAYALSPEEVLALTSPTPYEGFRLMVVVDPQNPIVGISDVTGHATFTTPFINGEYFADPEWVCVENPKGGWVQFGTDGKVDFRGYSYLCALEADLPPLLPKT